MGAPLWLAQAAQAAAGFAHLATLVKRLKSSRPGALLLDGGDTWQGSGPSLWTKGQDMIDAQKLLGVDIMTCAPATMLIGPLASCGETGM